MPMSLLSVPSTKTSGLIKGLLKYSISPKMRKPLVDHGVLDLIPAIFTSGNPLEVGDAATLLWWISLEQELKAAIQVDRKNHLIFVLILSQ